MKTVNEFVESMSISEIKEFSKKLQCWLGLYTHEVYVKVMSHMEEIINNEFTMKLIDELYIRTQKEKSDEWGIFSD